MRISLSHSPPLSFEFKHKQNSTISWPNDLGTKIRGRRAGAATDGGGEQQNHFHPHHHHCRRRHFSLSFPLSFFSFPSTELAAAEGIRFPIVILIRAEKAASCWNEEDASNENKNGIPASSCNRSVSTTT